MKYPRWLTAAALMAAVALGASGCSGSETPPPDPAVPRVTSSSAPPSSSSAAPTSSTSPAPSEPTADVTPAPAPPAKPKPKPKPPVAAWSTDKQSAGPAATSTAVPLLDSIRVGAHPAEGFDRITFDFIGPVPGYVVEYVSRVVQDPSGNPVELTGPYYLQVVFISADAHHEDGSVPPGLQRKGSPGYQRLKAYVINGDFEATVSVALGLSGKAGFRVGKIPGQPHSRLYIDVQR